MNQYCLAERHHQRKKHHQRLNNSTKGKLKNFLENLMAIFGVTSYIILGKTTNHSDESSVRHKEELSRTSRANKTLKYFWLKPSVLASKTETTQTEKRKLSVTLELLNEVSTEFTETKNFINEYLEQKCLKENISVEEVIYFSLISLEAKN